MKQTIIFVFWPTIFVFWSTIFVFWPCNAIINLRVFSPYIPRVLPFLLATDHNLRVLTVLVKQIVFVFQHLLVTGTIERLRNLENIEQVRVMKVRCAWSHTCYVVSSIFTLYCRFRFHFRVYVPCLRFVAAGLTLQISLSFSCLCFLMLQLFETVHGIGPTTAGKLYAQVAATAQQHIVISWLLLFVYCKLYAQVAATQQHSSTLLFH